MSVEVPQFVDDICVLHDRFHVCPRKRDGEITEATVVSVPENINALIEIVEQSFIVKLPWESVISRSLNVQTRQIKSDLERRYCYIFT